MSEDEPEELSEAVQELVDRAAPPELAPDDARSAVWERVSSDLELEGPDADPENEEGPSDEGAEAARTGTDSASVSDAAGLGDWLLGASRVRAAATFLAGAVVGAGAYGIADALWSEREVPRRTNLATVDAAVGDDVRSVDTGAGDAGLDRDVDGRVRTPDADAGRDAAVDGGSQESRDAKPSGEAEQQPRKRPGAAPPERGESTESKTDTRKAPDAGSDAPSGVSHERLLLSQAQAALGRNRPDEALEAARAHEKRYPEGQLVEERKTLHIRALYESGREEEAARRARTFLRNYPDSIFRSSVEEFAEADADTGD